MNDMAFEVNSNMLSLEPCCYFFQTFASNMYQNELIGFLEKYDSSFQRELGVLDRQGRVDPPSL